MLEVKFSSVAKDAADASKHVATLSLQLNSLQTHLSKVNAAAETNALGKYVDGLKRAQSQVAALSGQLKPATADTKSFGAAMKELGPELQAVATAATGAIVVVAGLATSLGLVLHAVAGIAQEQRALEASLGALAAGATSGKALADTFDRLSSVLPMTSREMGELSKTLLVAGVRDLPRIEQAMKAAAAANAVMGDTAGGAGKRMTDLIVTFNDAIKARQGIGDLRSALRGTGISIDEVAAKMGVSERALQAMAASGRNLGAIGNTIQDALIRKGIGPMREMGATWDVVSKKFHENVTNLFTGIADTPGFKSFMLSMLRIVDLFGESNAAGKTMKSGMTSAFDAVFGAAAKMTRAIHIGLLQAVVLALQFYISLKPTIRAVRDVWTAMKGAEQAKVIWIGFKAVVGHVATSLWSLVKPAMRFWGIVVSIGAALLWLVGISVGTVAKIKAGFSGIVSKAKGIGTDFVAGLWEGIKKAWKGMIEKIKGLTKLLPDVVKKALGIASPSKVMMEIGGHTAEGMALGIERGQKRVESATEGLADSAVSGAGGGGGKGRSSGGITLHLAAGAIVIQGAGSSGEALQLTEEALTSVLERWALSQGAMVPT